MPNPTKIGSTYYLRVQIPADLAELAKDTEFSVPVGDGIRTAKVGSVVKVSLRTKEPAEAKRRFTPVLAAVERHWEALRNGPTNLSHKDCVALAGELRQNFIEILDENPGSPSMWEHVRASDRRAALLQQLAVSEVGKPSASGPIPNRFGGFADALLRRHGLIVDDNSRKRLIEQVSVAMEDATRINLQKAGGDYSESGETDRYPVFSSKPKNSDRAARAEQTEGSVTFGDVVEREVKARATGKDTKPLPDKTAAKYRLAAKEFGKHRGSDDATSVTAREVDSWKVALQEAGKLTSKTIAQRLQNLRTVLEWLRSQSYGDVYADGNPVDVVRLPKGQGVLSADRTLTLSEAETILLASRMSDKPELRWLPWMMAYSGARVGEVAQLLPTDFFPVGDDWFYRITSKGGKTVKNAHSIRRVPVHPALIEEGLMDHVQARFKNQPNERLFPPNTQGNLGRWVRREVGLTRQELAPNHGWRHLFEDLALQAGMQEAAKLYITGRSSGRSSDQYGKSGAMLPALAAEMRKLKPLLES